MNDEEIECYGTDEIACPHCGYVSSDSYEYIRDHNEADIVEIDCMECDQTFFMTHEFSVTYSTEKPPLKDDEFNKMLSYCLEKEAECDQLNIWERDFLKSLSSKDLLHPGDKDRLEYIKSNLIYWRKKTG